MNAQVSLFDVVGSRPAEVTGSTETGHGRGVAAPPTARNSDPTTSHEAAAAARRGNSELIKTIRWWLSKQSEPKSAFQISAAVAGYRWQSDTVRTAVSRAGLHAVDNEGRTPGDRRCLRYVLRAD